MGVRASERILLSIDDLNTAAERLGLDAEGLLSEPRLYVDRFGEYKVPFGVAVKVAKPCCERFSREVLRHLQAEEEELRQELVSGYLDVFRGELNRRASSIAAEIRGSGRRYFVYPTPIRP
ncbi:MAG TPA: hypothetical protein VKA82_00055 [Rubrobacter sp.]|nr:hypothetical protein [Rubrobacter sp.]